MRLITKPRSLFVPPRTFRQPVHPILDKSHPLSRGLIGFWPLGDSTVSAAELVSGNDGVAVNGPLTLTPNQVGGVANGFNGSNQAITVAGPVGHLITGALLNPERFSLVAYAYTTSSSTGQALIGCSNSGVTQTSYYMQNQKTGFGHFTEVTYTSGAISTNVWHHMATTFDGTTLTAYLDGVTNGSTTGGAPDSLAAGNLAIGRFGSFTGGSFWTGNIAAVRIYDRGISADEVRWLLAEPYAGTYERNYYIVGASNTIVTSTGSISLDIAVAGTSSSSSAATGTVGIDIAVSGSGKTIINSIGSLSLNVAITGSSSALAHAVGAISISVSISGVVVDANIRYLPIYTIMRNTTVPASGEMDNEIVACEGTFY